MEVKKEWWVCKDSAENLLQDGCHSPSPPSSSWHRRLHSAPDDHGMLEDALHMSPQSSQYSNSIVHLERSLHEQCSLRTVLEKALGCNSLTSIASNDTPIPKPAADLIKEITVLELEVMRLEQYLISLYRTAFNNHLASLPSAVMRQGSGSVMQDSGLLATEQTNCRVRCNQACVDNDSFSDIVSQSNNLEHKRKQTDCTVQQAQIYDLQSSHNSDSRTNPPSVHPKSDNQNSVLGPRILADHLGASLADLLPETPNRLSEDIVRCMCAIYCKLADPPLTQIGGLLASPTSSLSSSSIFSPEEHCDNWSLRCNNNEHVNSFELEGSKEKNRPYWGMIEVSKITLDDDRFNYAETELQNFRSLVQRLERVDPRKMKHEQRLAFWINIHNALVMHACLAYGSPHNKKITCLSQKAGYNIGGHYLNADVIQSSILGCSSTRPTPWLRTLFSPGVKLGTGNARHVYGLDHPEPLVHFALCSGGYSDPAVRIYTAKSIYQELEVAREEFIQVTVSMQKEKRIILPRLLYHFAKDASLDVWGILDMVHDCLPEAQKKCIQRLLTERVSKYVEWAPYNSSFRYIMHRELVKG